MARMDMAKRIGQEKLAGGELDNKQFNDFVTSGPLLDFFTKPDAGAHAARAERRRRFGRPAGRAEPRLPQHRPLQRGMAAALQPGGRRQGHHADQDRRRAEELELLAGDRGGHAEHRAVLPEGGAARPAEGRARRRQVPGDDAATLEQGQARLCRHLRALPFEQGAPPPADVAPAQCAGAGYLDCFKRYWTWTQTDEYKQQMRKIVAGAGLPGGQLPLDRRAHPGRRCCAPTPAARWPPTRWAATSGTTSRRRPTSSCLRSAR